MSIEPGAIALKGRSRYYAAEARRVQNLADRGPGEGHDRFLEVAREYRSLAAWYDDGDSRADEPAALKLQPPAA
ncbi:hypothetical protein [Phenylobacterium sp.]|uniref:hypothetical protein n=1 Tax=Phenylobacterium sp. TaxID=1871053 RepID=UPI003BAD609F